MFRAFFEEALLFLIPFAIFALYLILRRRNPFLWAHWSDQSFWLVDRRPDHRGGLAALHRAHRRAP